MFLSKLLMRTEEEEGSLTCMCVLKQVQLQWKVRSIETSGCSVEEQKSLDRLDGRELGHHMIIKTIIIHSHHRQTGGRKLHLQPLGIKDGSQSETSKHSHFEPMGLKCLVQGHNDGLGHSRT